MDTDTDTPGSWDSDYECIEAEHCEGNCDDPDEMCEHCLCCDCTGCCYDRQRMG